LVVVRADLEGKGQPVCRDGVTLYVKQDESTVWNRTASGNLVRIEARVDGDGCVDHLAVDAALGMGHVSRSRWLEAGWGILEILVVVLK